VRFWGGPETPEKVGKSLMGNLVKLAWAVIKKAVSISIYILKKVADPRTVTASSFSRGFSQTTLNRKLI